MHDNPFVERRTERKMVLTDADIHAIAKKVEEVHVCRYDIDPEDMHKLMGFVRAFYDGAIDTRRTFRTMFIRMVAWGSVAGLLTLLEVKFRWIRPLLRWITGTPT